MLILFSCSFAIGIVGDAGVRGTAQQPRLYVGMILILIFAEVLGKSIYMPFGASRPTALLVHSLIYTSHRSLRFDRCSSHELPLDSRRPMLNGSIHCFYGWIRATDKQPV